MTNKKNFELKSINVSELELDMLLLYYTFADQYGRVDMQAAASFATKTFGYVINQDPITIGQTHVDVLMDRGCIPDTRAILGIY